MIINKNQIVAIIIYKNNKLLSIANIQFVREENYLTDKYS
jgi:hypothetical protein